MWIGMACTSSGGIAKRRYYEYYGRKFSVSEYTHHMLSFHKADIFINTGKNAMVCRVGRLDAWGNYSGILHQGYACLVNSFASFTATVSLP